MTEKMMQNLENKMETLINRNSRGYITKLGFDQHPDSNSAGKSHVPHLESQLGKCPRHHISSVGEMSKIAVWGSYL